MLQFACKDVQVPFLQVRANQKQLKVSWAVDENVPEHLMGDAGRLQQCLINLGTSTELLRLLFGCIHIYLSLRLFSF